MSLQNISLYAMAGFYIIAGLSHFLQPKFFLKIMPRWIPFPKRVNLLVGCIEIVLAVGLMIPNFQSLSAMAIIALLIAVFPANIHHYQQARSKGKQVIATLIRLPIQGLLIYWAYTLS